MPTLAALEKDVLRNLAEREAQYHAQLQAQLKSSLDSIYAEMTKIYGKYAKDGKLSKVEMTAYNKYQTMEKNILAKLDPAIKANIQTIKKLMPEMYDESFFRYAWAMDNATGVALTYGAVNTKALLAAFDVANPKNIEIREALHNYGPAAKKKIRSALLKNLAMGKSYAQMAKDLDASMNSIYSNAMTIARTEGQRAINKGQNDVYTQAKANGVEGNMYWVATLDQRTRPDHGAMDGVMKSDDGLYHGAIGEAQYPNDPNLPAEQSINCRCRERFEIDGYSPQLRRTREEGLIPYVNYDDYIKQYHPDWKAGAKPITKAPAPKPILPIVKLVKAPKVIPPKPVVVKPTPAPVTPVPKPAIQPQLPFPGPSMSSITGVQDAIVGDPYYTKFDSAKIVSTQANGKRGVNPSYIVDLETPDGTPFRGVMKIEGSGDDIVGEYGTYLVDRAIGVNRVPNVLYKTYQLPTGRAEKVIMQEFVKGFREAVKVDESVKKTMDRDELARVSVLDWITNNKDRHHKNWMISKDNGTIAAIDNGRALWHARGDVYSEPWEYLNRGKAFAVPADVLATMKIMDIDGLVTDLTRLGLPKDSIALMKSRIQDIIRTGRVEP